MITVTQHTQDILLARGIIALGLSSNKYISTSGVAAIGSIVLTADPVHGDTLLIIFNDTELEFTFATSPDDSGLQLPLNTSANREAYALDQLLPALKKNRVLYRAFTLAHNSAGPSTTAQIDLTCRSTGSISLAITSSVAGTSTVTDGTDQITATNHGILLDIYAEQTFPNQDYTLHAALDLKTDANGALSADLSPFMQSLFSQCLLPEIDQADIIRSMGTFARRVCMRFGDKYGETIAVKRFDEYSKATEATPILVLNGGLSNAETPDNTFVADYATDTAERKFLTKAPGRTLYIDATSPAYLAYINLSATTEIAAHFVIYYTNGDTDTHDLSLDITGYSGLGKDVYLIPCGVAALELTTINPAKTIDYYTVQVEDSATHTSEIFTFIYNPAYYRAANYILFQNSLGAPEILWCSGDLLKGADFAKDAYTLPLDHSYQVSDRQKAAYNHSHANKWLINTGNRYPKAYIQYLERELLMSPYTYILLNGQYQAIEIDKKTIELKPEDDGIWSLEFECIESFNNQSA